jgi:NhaC family Na+:H+ antiporter
MSSVSTARVPTLAEALVPVVALAVFMAASVIDVNALPEVAVVTPVLQFLAALPWVGSVLQTSLPTQIPLAAAAGVAALMALRLGWRWHDIEHSFADGIRLSLNACLILIAVGMLIGTWIAGGVVPMLIVYGLKLISPQYFLLAACVGCSFVSVATGSSWTTAGTVGIAFIGIGTALGIPVPMVAGAIISGAYFGDKMSPLSETTNLAPAMVGAGLFEHVRHMAWTTGPSMTIALVLYWLLGLRYGAASASLESVETITTTLTASYTISPWLLVPPALILLMVYFRLPALPAVLIGAIVGGLFASLFQGASLAAVLDVAYNGVKAETGVAAVDNLLSRGGMSSMYGTIGIIFCAMCFGGVMEKSGMLGTIAASILRLARSTGSLITATLATCIGSNIFAPDQYLSIVVPGRMYREAYEKAGLHPKNLSRALEDSATITSPLIPWNSCGAFMFATLGVFPFAYAPYAFLNIINPLVSALYGWTGWTIERLPPQEQTPPRAI